MPLPQDPLHALRRLAGLLGGWMPRPAPAPAPIPVPANDPPRPPLAPRPR